MRPQPTARPTASADVQRREEEQSASRQPRAPDAHEPGAGWSCSDRQAGDRGVRPWPGGSPRRRPSRPRGRPCSATRRSYPGIQPSAGTRHSAPERRDHRHDRADAPLAGPTPGRRTRALVTTAHAVPARASIIAGHRSRGRLSAPAVRYRAQCHGVPHRREGFTWVRRSARCCRSRSASRSARVPIIAVILVLFSARAPFERAGLPRRLGRRGRPWSASSCTTLADSGDTSDETNSGGSDTVLWIKLALGVCSSCSRSATGRESRAASEKPQKNRWMQSIDSLTPVKAGGLALLLSGANPKNLALSLGAGASLAQAGVSGGEAAVGLLVFVVIASASIGVPVIFYLAGGERADAGARRLEVLAVDAQRHGDGGAVPRLRRGALQPGAARPHGVSRMQPGALGASPGQPGGGQPGGGQPGSGRRRRPSASSPRPTPRVGHAGRWSPGHGRPGRSRRSDRRRAGRRPRGSTPLRPPPADRQGRPCP